MTSVSTTVSPSETSRLDKKEDTQFVIISTMCDFEAHARLTVTVVVSLSLSTCISVVLWHGHDTSLHCLGDGAW
jgi:hypothetical protein